MNDRKKVPDDFNELDFISSFSSSPTITSRLEGRNEVPKPISSISQDKREKFTCESESETTKEEKAEIAESNEETILPTQKHVDIKKERKKSTKGIKGNSDEIDINKDLYINTFFADCSDPFNKTIRISESHHSRIQDIVAIIGNKEFTISYYINNIINEHLNKYDNTITEVYNSILMSKLKKS